MKENMVTPEEFVAILDLMARYTHAIDNDRLEDWIECFTDTCNYKIITLENVQQGLEAGMLTCNSRAMLLDRVAYIRKAAVFNVHRDRHLVGHPLIRRVGDTRFEATTGFTVHQSEPERESRLFAVGYYEDVIVHDGGVLKFQSRTAVLENNSIKPLLSSPI